MFKHIFFILIIILLNNSVNAKVFRNAYLSFEMPESWKCTLEQTEWVCRSEVSKEAKEAIIILTAKEIGPTDTIQKYEEHLNSPITVTNKLGVTTQSQIQYKAKKTQINDQTWIDGLHLGSEVKNYFTRYAATTKDKIAVLVTFSAHKDFYTKYSADFYKALMSLRIIATKNLSASSGAIRPSDALLSTNVSGALDANPFDEQPKPKGNSERMKYFGLAMILLALGAYFFIRAKKKK